MGMRYWRETYALKTIWIDDNYFNARSMDVSFVLAPPFVLVSAPLPPLGGLGAKNQKKRRGWGANG
jgi:hypothetical protein